MKATMSMLFFLLLVLGGGFLGFSGLEFVGPDEMLVVIARYGRPLGEKLLADPGEIGIRKEVLGAGFHWIMPIVFETKRVKVFEVPSRKIGVLTAKYGDRIQGDRFLAEEGEIGIRRVVLGPGTYRFNPYGYDLDLFDQMNVPAGYVGVLINNQQGGVVRDQVLNPGLHYINPRMYKVELVKIGLSEHSRATEQRMQITDKLLRGEVKLPVSQSSDRRATEDLEVGGAISFPSKDGFIVGLDVTLMWELTPKNAVAAIDTFGRVTDLVERVINPKLDSSCRNSGSNYTAKDMIQGDSRTLFQTSFKNMLIEYAKEAPLEIVAVLPLRVYVPMQIQLPIMQAQLKKEEMLTNHEIEETSKVEARLEEQKKLVDQEIQQVKADTAVLRRSIRAQAEKEVGEFEAETKLLVAKIALETQKIDTQIAVTLSEADAEVARFRGNKEAELNRLQVDAFGGAETYNAYIFATQALPEEKLSVRILHAGEGTLWTDSNMQTDPTALKTLSEVQKMRKNILE